MNNEWYKTTQHTRFAHIWNEIVDAMREEDIISYGEKCKVNQQRTDRSAAFYLKKDL